MNSQITEGLSGVRAEYPIEQVQGLNDLVDGAQELLTGMQHMLAGMKTIIKGYRLRDPAQRGKVVPFETSHGSEEGD